MRSFVHTHAKYVLTRKTKQTGILEKEKFISLSTEEKKKLMDAFIEVCVKKVFDYNERILDPRDKKIKTFRLPLW